MFKKLGLSMLILLVVSSYVYAGPLAASLASSSHSKSTWSNVNKITTTWTKPSASADYGAVKGYAIVWDTVADTNPGTAITLDNPNSTSTTSNPLSDGQSIYFHIRVVYEDGSPFTWDNFGPFWVDTTAPSKPTSFTITAGDGTLTLNWTNPGDADFAGTVIRRSTKTGDTCSYPTGPTTGDAVTDVTKDTSPNNTTTNTGRVNGTTYCYSIFSYDQRATGMRNYSDAAQASGKPASSGATVTYATVSATDPNGNATDVPITSAISIGFSKDMNSSTLSSTTISTKDALNNTISGTYAYTTTTKTVKFTPTSSLSYSTKYTTTILSGSSGVKDSQGNNFDGNANGKAEDAPTDNYTFSFTTVAATPPDVSSITPADTSTNIAVNQKIVILFTKNLDSNTVSTSTVQIKIGTAAVEGTVEYNDLDKSVTFTPKANYTGGATVSITIVGGANGIKDSSGLQLKNSTYTYSFTIVDTPILQTSAASLDFGNVSTTGGTKTATLNVKNIGKLDLKFGTAAISSTTYYTFTSDGCSLQTLAKDASCNITIQFAPTVAGTLSTTLVILSNSGRADATPSSSKSVALTGTGVTSATAGINVNPTSIDFGNVSLNTSSAESTITITSNGTLALEIGGISLQKGNAGFAATDKSGCENKTIALNSTCTIKVKFSPTVTGTASDILVIQSNNGRTDQTKSVNSTVNLNAYGKQSAQTINLSSGWNLISIPLSPVNAATPTVFKDISNNVTIVWEFTPPGTWKSYLPNDYDPGDSSAIHTVNVDKGYWVKTKNASDLVITGDQIGSTKIGLASGWNLVGFKQITDAVSTTALAGIAGSTTIVWEFTNPGTWKSYLPNDYDAGDSSAIHKLVVGKGYWIKTKNGIDWTLP